MKAHPFAIPAEVRRQVAGNPFPVLEYLTGGLGAWSWTKSRAEAVTFPDFGAQGCKDGAKCAEHAECVARVVEGFPFVVPKEDAR